MDVTNLTHEEKIAQQTKRLDILVRRFETIFSFGVPVLAVIAGLAVAGLLILSLGVSPFQAYAAMFKGAFGNSYAIGTTLNKATPLILTGIGFIIAFRSGLFNIGGEGQICMGGFAAAVAGIYITGLPVYIHIPVAFLAAFIAGGIWSLLAGYLYSKYKVNMLISTIMMNYIAIAFISIMVKGPIQEPPGYFMQSRQLLETSWLPILGQSTRLHSGLILALACAIIFHIVLWHTPFGYQIRAIGENEVAARHAGMKVMRDQLIVMFISGGLAGLAGAVEIMGAQYRLRPNFLQNFGFDAIAVALLGQTQPLATIISGILFGALRAGAGTMQRTINLPMSLVFDVQGIIILFVVGSSMLMRLPRYLAKKRLTVGIDAILSMFTTDYFYAVVRIAAPIMIAAIGEVYLERSGMFNMGIEAMMLFGAFFGFLGARLAGNAFIGLITAMASSALFGLFFGFMAITLRSNQVVTGAAINIFALGLTSFLFRVIFGMPELPPQAPGFGVLPIPVLSNIPVIGKVLFTQTLPVYIIYIMIIVMTLILKRTTWGLKIRAVGEFPRAAHTVGINVIGWRYGCAILSGALAGFAGATLSLANLTTFVDNMSAGRGFIALAAVTLGRWDPVGVTIASLFFGAADALQMRVQVFGVNIQSDILLALPYVVTLLAVVLFRGKVGQPASMGQAYDKEAA